jgi:hypothetical protein
VEGTGISFTNSLPENKLLENSIRFNGCGVAAGDIDGDGLCDLFFCSLEGRSHLYRNLGNWRFAEITSEAGVSCPGLYTSGCAFADVDGDGSLDLLVNAYGSGTRLFINDGHGHFTEKKEAGLVSRSGSTSLTLADIDGNGTLDLYVANYATSTMADHPNARLSFKNISGKPTLLAIDEVPIGNDPEMQNRFMIDPSDGKLKQGGEPDTLYLNKGNGIFETQAWTDGRFLDERGKALTSAPYDWGLSAMFRDINGDGFPDLYVCNDLFSPDRVWINDGSGHFRAASNFAVRHTSHSSMGVDFADINRDGTDDFLVLDMLSPKSWLRKVHVVGLNQETFPPGRINNRPQSDQNTLFLGRGDGTFAEIGQLAGLDASGWSWLPVFLDVDLDGYEDVLITTGYFRDSLNADLTAKFTRKKLEKNLTASQILELQHQVFPLNPLPKVAFRNRGDLTFEDASKEWRFNDVAISQGMCLADLDNDGDLDVIINNFGSPPTLYRNETSAPRVAVRLKGISPNTRGIGAKITFNGGPVRQTQQMICGGRYLSSDNPERVFAVGASKGPFTIQVAWRSGRSSVISNVEPNCVYEVDETQAGPEQTSITTTPQPLFRDVSHLLGHVHSETPFDDFANQPLLPRSFSTAGPSVAWADVDGDGWPDLLIGGGRGGSLAVLLNDGSGHFHPATVPVALRDLKAEEGSVLCIPKGDGGAILVGQSNYEKQTTNSVLQIRSGVTGLDVDAGLPAIRGCPGPMALADVDGDGYLDLFLGGRLLPGNYPAPASSQLFKGRADSGFVPDSEANELFKGIGMVNGAVFSDLDGDGWPDLILAMDWGPLRIFHNDKGHFHEITKVTGLEKFTGWWNGVITGDFDGDGKMDIAASNWGRNSKYERYRSAPLRIYYGQWNGQEDIRLLEAYTDSDLRKIVPVKGFDSVRRALPWVQARFTSFEDYGRASVEEVLGDRLPSSTVLEANTLESMIWLNRGDHFEPRLLPIEAQFAPAFGICVADLDGDGNEDLFLAQNFYSVDHETSRYDAGRGLMLRGDGKGGFTAVPGQTSGIQVYGDQRGAALCDYDADGRVDLVVSQNGTTTKLYHNQGAKPGLRVTLGGKAGNPIGVGAQLRLVYASSAGPVREIHAGSGYWSQDGATQVLGRKEPPLKLWIRWPGGAEITYILPESAQQVTVDESGHLRSK